MSRRTVIGEAIITGQQPNGNFTPFAATAAVLATGVLTSDNTNVSAGDTVTIGPNVYTFVSLISSYGQVLVGSNADASLTNLAAVINAARAPFSVVTSSAVVSHALTITAIDDGSGGATGNQIVTTTTAAHLSWGASTLTGGSAGALAVSGPGGGGIPVTPAPLVGTYVPFAIASSGSGTIPITAKRWSFENSGSGNDSTMNGTIMAGNVTRSDQGSPATQITLVAGAANIITGFYSTT